jgi:NADH-quinone oxidoreductase subunit G
VGYGGTKSRYQEEKRVVFHKEAGPLISMQEMSRCIHCTRCVRFGQEIAGVMELGMSHRGEHAEIETFLGQSIDSELSGNMIDICPVGALTSRPFRYNARTWELSRRKSISPHDATGANLVVQVKNDKVMRVVPFENDAVNECWIADRDRFSYEALNSPERLTSPMIKQGGAWSTVDWKTALEYVARGLNSVRGEHGAGAIGALVSPHSTVEELYLAGQLVRGLGSENIDYRMRHAEFESGQPGARYLGMPVAAITQLQAALVVGSNLRKDHPLFAQRLRQAARNCATVSVIGNQAMDWAMPLSQKVVLPSSNWVQALADVAVAVAESLQTVAPRDGQATEQAQAIARELLSGERKAILLGNAAAHHPQASLLLGLANWIGSQTGASVGYLSEAANTVGAQLVGALPGQGGLNAAQMTGGALKATLLFNTEPEFDSAAGVTALQTLQSSQMVVTFSPFKANMAFSDVLLPIAPFTETPGTFINAEGRVQSFHAVTKPLGETRPGWKVLRALADVLDLADMNFDSAQAVMAHLNLAGSGADPALVHAERLSNAAAASATAPNPDAQPCVAGIYQLDGLVRRASSLQQTADAKLQSSQEVAA